MDLDPKTAFVWTPDDLMELPRRGLVDLGVPAEKLPDEDWVPRRLEGMYDADAVPAPLRAFSVIQLQAGATTIETKLVILGVVPGAPDLLYVLDTATFEVLQFDRRTKGVRGVNSSYRWFVEFLWQFEARKKQTGAERFAEVLNPGFRATLDGIDPFAFQAQEQWWPGVWRELRPSAPPQPRR
jgi:hypothetical protein